MNKQLRIGGVPEHFNLPWQQAIDAGAFDALNVDVDYTEYPAGTGAMTAALTAGELDAALLLTEGAVADILGGSNNRLVSVYVDTPLIWGIHVAANSDIKDASEIQGKRYAISRFGSGSHLIAIVDAAERGFPTGEMAFETIESMKGARAALADGSADVFLWEKFITQPIVDAGEFRRVGERAVPWPSFVVSARLDYVIEHAATLRAVLEVVRAFAERFKESEDSVALISRTYNMKLADAKTWLEQVQWSSDSRCPEEALARVIEALQAQGVVATAAPSAMSDIWYALDPDKRETGARGDE